MVGFGPAQRLRIQSRLGNTAASGGELAKLHERFSAPYKAKNTKSILWAVDMYGPDHRTVDGSTPLMIAARVGNTSLVKELLARGANPAVRDEFGHTAWMWFLDAFVIVRNRSALPAELDAIVELMFELIAPSVIDVQTEGKLIRLNRKQAEYWFFTFMQTAMKGRVEENPFLFDAAKMEQLMERLPATLWPANRRKRAYTSGVLSRAAVDSPYVPARDLWTRVRTGVYAVNPTMHLRNGDTWQPFYAAMRLEWIMVGNGNLYRREFRDLVAGEFARTKR